MLSRLTLRCGAPRAVAAAAAPVLHARMFASQKKGAAEEGAAEERAPAAKDTVGFKQARRATRALETELSQRFGDFKADLDAATTERRDRAVGTAGLRAAAQAAKLPEDVQRRLQNRYDSIRAGARMLADDLQTFDALKAQAAQDKHDDALATLRRALELGAPPGPSAGSPHRA